MGQSVGQTPNLVLVRVWDEGAWAIFDRSPLGSAVPWRVSVDGGAPSPAGKSLVHVLGEKLVYRAHYVGKET